MDDFTWQVLLGHLVFKGGKPGIGVRIHPFIEECRGEQNNV